MKISRLELNNFMLFDSLQLDWSSNINIISGENSTGKTTILKFMYAVCKSICRNQNHNMTKDQFEGALVEKMLGVFRPDQMVIGRLAGRRQGNNRTDNRISFGESGNLAIGFSRMQDRHASIQTDFPAPIELFDPVYLPPKEMISATEHFQSLYEEYHIDFEETYYDLTKLLDKPLKKGPNSAEQSAILIKFESILKGKVTQKDKKFYLKIQGSGEFEMGLVSEGYRKLATIIYLISSGSLDRNSILFWDEPETNMNPKMIRPIAEAIIELAKLGVQVFISTHDYFVQQAFNLETVYKNNENPDIRFVSLYEEAGKVRAEVAPCLSELSHNSVMEEFDHLYDREQELLYDH